VCVALVTGKEVECIGVPCDACLQGQNGAVVRFLCEPVTMCRRYITGL